MSTTIRKASTTERINYYIDSLLTDDFSVKRAQDTTKQYVFDAFNQSGIEVISLDKITLSHSDDGYHILVITEDDDFNPGSFSIMRARLKRNMDFKGQVHVSTVEVKGRPVKTYQFTC